jgi:hypothetical protein
LGRGRGRGLYNEKSLHKLKLNTL